MIFEMFADQIQMFSLHMTAFAFLFFGTVGFVMAGDG